MSYFEFIMVMFSIIVGLGIADLLNNIARQLRAGKDCEGYWLQSLVVVAVLLGLLQQWWESWGLQSVEHWGFLFVLMFLAGPIGLYLVAHLLFPRRMSGGDLEQHYFSVFRQIWVIAGLVVIVATLFRPVAFGDALLVADNMSAAVLLAFFAVLASSSRKVVHAILVPLILISLFMDIVFFSLFI